MKKILFILAFITIILIFVNKKEEYVVIPSNSIRFRIIPNSNALEDIAMKEKVKEEINDTIKDIETSNSIDESRKLIVNNIPVINKKIDNLFKENNYDKSFNIKYGLNYFPEKVYKGVKYTEGEYESMVIEIGNASGDNYWCVLFPPLCMIDAKESTDVEYKFFISEVINKFLKQKKSL